MVFLPSDPQFEKLTVEDVKRAYTLIKEDVRVTPVFNFPEFDALVDSFNSVKIFIKAELFQKTGAFKYRGVCHALARLTPDELANGVITHSSGNHAIALSQHAQQKGIPCHIILVHLR
jgi:threonine dehydratase